MERFTISKSEKQTIYEIYRACRLCGAGGGYRMPIIQNILDIDSTEVELRQKIQECLQLEIRPDDRMPPLICELCVDKVNDYYKFLELTRQTNVRTRTRLGLPLQIAKKGEPEPSDCILGVTEPVYVEDDEPLAKKAKAGPKCSKKMKKEPEVVVKVDSASSSSSRSSSASRAAPAPRTQPRRAATAPAPEPQVPKERPKRNKELENLLEDSTKYDDNALLVPRAVKRTREEPPQPALLPRRPTRAVPSKEPVKEPTPPRSKPGPMSRKTRAPPKAPELPKAPEPVPAPEPPKPEPKRIPVPAKAPKSKAKPPEPVKVKETPKPAEETPQIKTFTCVICEATTKTAHGLVSHMKSHTPTFTKPANACNPCGKWFPSAEEAGAHHRYHRAATFPYHCQRCFDDFRSLPAYNEHIDNGQCLQSEERPDVVCAECLASFPTEPLRRAHKCPGRDGRPGGKCGKCSRTYATAKTLKKHESQCSLRRKRDLIADPDVLRRLKPMQVRVARCDDLLAAAGGPVDVSGVKPNYGLAKNYVYPYLKLNTVKPQPLRDVSMVAIPVALKEEFQADYTHWDSEDSDSDNVMRRVPTLTTLAIKKLFSKHLLGKLPRKKKRVKNETFENENDFSMSSDINDIISSLGDDLGNVSLGRKDLTAKIKDIIGCLDDDASEHENEGRDENETTLNETAEGQGQVSSDNFESTNENLIQSGELNDNSVVTNNVEVNNSVGTSDNVLHSNNSYKDEENEKFKRIDSENDHYSDVGDDDRELCENNHKNIENEGEMEADTEKTVPVNGSANHECENSFEDDSKNNDSDEQKKTEEIIKPINKESPIKHSIENLIGESEKNPDKYINEVISSIEDIITNNRRNDELINQVNGREVNETNDSNLIQALEENTNGVGEKRISDQDKITLEDLLPKADRRMQLEDISDDDFNFDS